MSVVANHPSVEMATQIEQSAQSLMEVRDTTVGSGVFARKCFAADVVVSEISGERLSEDDPRADGDYCMCIGEEKSLEPSPPFRFLNHSCDPNCEYDYWDAECEETGELRLQVLLIAIREIQAGEQLTIDYSWPADCAIPCLCGSESCRGWIVAAEELSILEQRRQ